MLAATGDSAVNCFVFALDVVTGFKLKAEERTLKIVTISVLKVLKCSDDLTHVGSCCYDDLK